MEAGDIVRIARQRAGLSQEQLGIRSGLHRNVIGRWERGDSQPSLAALRRLVDACGFDLVLRLSESDQSLDDLVEDQLALTPAERVDTMLQPGGGRQAREALRWLAHARTPTILIGDIAAALQGGPHKVPLAELEIISRDPVSTARELDASGFTAVDCEARWRDTDRREPWRHRSGATVAIATDVPGTAGYADLRRNSEELELDDTSSVAVAHPRDLLRLADASHDERAQARAPGLRALLNRSGEVNRSGEADR